MLADQEHPAYKVFEVPQGDEEGWVGEVLRVFEGRSAQTEKQGKLDHKVYKDVLDL